MPSSPSARRVASLIWFPFFFVALFSVLGLFAYSHPAPHGFDIRVVGSTSEAQTIQHELDAVREGGFAVTATPSVASARASVRDASAVAAYVPGHPAQVFVASAGSASRATYVTGVFTALGARSGTTVDRVDVVPSAAGDVSGISLMFIGLPLGLVGLISVLVMLQFGAWKIRPKLLVIAAAGTFASLFVYFLATAMNVIPQDEWLLLYGFLLTQAIGWVALGAAYFTKQFFLPVIMTFVLVLGTPTAGASVVGDMLPVPLQWLNDVLPLAQYVKLARSSAYFGNHGLVLPLLIMILWLVTGAALVFASSRHSRRVQQRAHAALTLEAEQDDLLAVTTTGRVHGTVTLGNGAPTVDAAVIVLGRRGDEVGRGYSDADGHFAIDDVPVGVHALLVTAEHCQPVVVTIDVHEGPTAPSRRLTLIDWQDPSGDLTGEGLDGPLHATRAIAGGHHASHKAV